MLNVLIVSAQALLFEGSAQHVICPGEHGVFEVWPFHRPLVSRLLPGVIYVDDEPVAIKRGVVKIASNTVTALVEPEADDKGA